MKTLRILAIVGALLLMGGEAYRSWGAGRPIAFWMDDMLAGAMMIAAAIAVGRPTRVTRSFFSASWGVAVGLLYMSFFGKLLAPAEVVLGNIPIGILTAAVGLAFAAAIICLVASIVLPDTER